MLAFYGEDVSINGWESSKQKHGASLTNAGRAEKESRVLRFYTASDASYSRLAQNSERAFWNRE